MLRMQCTLVALAALMLSPSSSVVLGGRAPEDAAGSAAVQDTAAAAAVESDEGFPCQPCLAIRMDMKQSPTRVCGGILDVLWMRAQRLLRGMYG